MNAIVKPASFIRKATKAVLTLTPAAIRRVKEIRESKPDCLGLRIALKTKGCNGLAYSLDYASAKGKLDEEVKLDGASVFIDPKALLSIIGSARWIFKETKLKSEFVFHNPNAKGSCGCGESFNV